MSIETLVDNAIADTREQFPTVTVTYEYHTGTGDITLNGYYLGDEDHPFAEELYKEELDDSEEVLGTAIYRRVMQFANKIHKHFSPAQEPDPVEKADMEQEILEQQSIIEKDNWAHRSSNMLCDTCMYYVDKAVPEGAKRIGRCRRHAPTMSGFPAIFPNDWCGDHKIHELRLG